MFLIYAPSKITVESMQFKQNDSNILVSLPKDHKGYFTSIFKQNNTETISDNTQRIWKAILNARVSGSMVIEKNKPLGFFAITPYHYISIKHETATSAKKNKTKNSKKIQKSQSSIRQFFK